MPSPYWYCPRPTLLFANATPPSAANATSVHAAVAPAMTARVAFVEMV